MSNARFGRPVRILYMIDEMESITAGGTERQILQMIRLMRDAGAEMQLCVLRGTRWLMEDLTGCPIHFANVQSVFSPQGLRGLGRLCKWMRREQFDVLQTFFVDANIIGPLVGRSARVKTIIGSRRNLNHMMTEAQLQAQRFSNRFTTRLLANCEKVGEAVRATEHVPTEKIAVIYNGLDLEALRPRSEDRERIRTRFGLTSTDVLIGNISTLRAVKRIPEMVQAAAVVCRSCPRAKFLVVGEGPERSAIEVAITAERLKDSFWLAGAQEDVRPYLAALDIGILCSEAEGLSNTILEYLAAGLPSVATDVGGNAEALGDAGLLVHKNDVMGLAKAMLELSTDPRLREDLAERAKVRARLFSLPEISRALVAFYESCLPS